MSNLTPSLIRRLSGDVLRRLPSSRGWTLLGHSQLGAQAVQVHIRHYLAEPGLPPGFHVETYPLSSFKLCDDPRYVNLFVRRGEEHLAPELYDLVAEAQRRALPWLTIGVEEESEVVIVYEQDGTQREVSLTVPPLSTRPLHLQLLGHEVWQTETCLPLAVNVTASAPAAAFSIKLSDQTGFSKNAYHFVVRGREGRPLGPGALRLDVRCTAGALDEITLTPSGFASPPTEVEEWAEAARTEPEPIFHQGVVNLHLVFDRTTLDVDAWPLAYEALDSAGSAGVRDEASQAYATGAPEPLATENWNLQLREELAAALGATVGSLHDDVALHLWWFADRPRDGIAPNEALPHLNKAFGRVGHCLMKDLKARLTGPDFEYASGLDLFDAADEVLQQIVALLKQGVQSRREQHAVLIVGDSPPPPGEPGDMLWERLVGQPDRTSARTSHAFNGALEDLRLLKIPIGWLFMRTSRAPSIGAGYRQFVRQFTAFQDLREVILSSLQQVEGMLVEDCAGPEDLRRGLGKLLGQLARDKPRIPKIRIDSIEHNT
jgi:hypothetical protein